MGAARVAVVLGVTAAVIAGTGYGVMQSPAGERLRGNRAGSETGTLVVTEQAAMGDVIRTVSAPGSIEPRTKVQISSQVSARVLALPFRAGDQVKEGDVVIRLDPQNLVAVLDSARAGLRGQEARLDGAEARLITARLEFERMRSLFETGDVTRSELEASEANFLQARSDKRALEHAIEQAMAQIEQAEKDLENTTIASPIDGVIVALNAEVGETVIVGTTNNPGSVIMEIADLSNMLLRAAIDEANIAPIRIGQDATIYLNAYPDREYRGAVRQIGLKRRVAQDGTGTFEVEIGMELKEGETLYSGLTASTDIAVEKFLDTVRVPSQAVLDRRVDELPAEIRAGNPLVDLNRTFVRVVYRVVDGRTVVTPVRAGASDLTHTQIIEGLEPGDTIVAGPFRVLTTLRHDMPVRTDAARDKNGNDDKNGEPSEDEREAPLAADEPADGA
ncbi:MAG: efflux RND transporter periplasmic adaptor subunit [Phycisphaerales bacterium]|nr:efflux RND transporter periplasmic adaptor subunit [Planctomycetota bacterium]MCH8509991.1 efflux RND transporter periplasmic adaptor subunit [Phycisphaerales bacterium]